MVLVSYISLVTDPAEIKTEALVAAKSLDGVEVHPLMPSLCTQRDF